MTYARTYNSIRFADPYKACQVCDERVVGVLCVDDAPWPNIPCGHVGYNDLCPSWSPVDGCRCLDHLGHVPHAVDITESVDGPNYVEGGE